MNRLSRRWTFSTLAILAAAAGPVVRAQTVRNWTGLGTDNLWTDTGNWDTAVPGGSDTASFSGSGNGNTTISLGGTTQSLALIQFVTATAGYTLGVLGSGDTLSMASGGSMVVGPNFVEPMVVNADVTTNGNFTMGNNVNNNTGTTGLTIGGNVFMSGGGTLTLDSYQVRGTILVSGNISDSATNAGSLSLTTTPTTGTGVNNFVFTGNNTYSGTTLISIYTGSGTGAGSIEIGTDSAFGTGRVTFVLHGNAAQWSSINGNHTVSNNMDLNAGPVTIGTNSLTFGGNLNIVNTSGAGRTLNNLMSAGGTVFYGSAGTSATLTAGNPVSNGGDGLGQKITFNCGANGGNMVVYDAIVDPGVGGGTSSGSIQIQAAGSMALYGQSTYTGNSTFTGAGTVIGIGSSTIMSGASIVSGPFGLGTIIPNQASGQHLRPLGGDQTVANPITMSSGLEMDNQAGDSSSLTLSGPITVGAGNLIQNGYGGTTATFGTFILGSATAASTITISNSALQFDALAGPVVVNDLIQGGTTLSINAKPGAAGVVTFNGTNTYSSTTTIVAGTLSISSDGNLGDGANAVSIGAASLLSTGSFTTSRSISLTDASLSTLDASAGNTLVLTGAVTDIGTINKGTGSGTVQFAQSPGYTATTNVNVNGGALAVGTTTSGVIAPINISGALTVANGASMVLLPATGMAVTHTINTLNLNSLGKLDVGNSSFYTTTSTSTIQSYLKSGYNGGAWNGSGAAIVSTSANLSSGSSTRSLGYASSTDSVAGSVIIPAGQTLVKYTTPGDADLSGNTDFNDFLALQNAYNKPGDWSQGDFDYTGTVDFNDFLILQNNYNHNLNANGTVAGGGAGAAKSALAKSASLTAAPAIPGAVVTYVLSPNDDGHGNNAPGKFAVYAIDSTADGNHGMASFSVDVQGATLVTNFAPKGTYDDGTNTGNTVAEGFTLLRTGNGAFSTLTDPAKSSQDTVDASGVQLIYGMGQLAGNLNSQAPAGSSGGTGKVQPTYAAELLVMTGTFSGSSLAFNTDMTFDKANVFLTGSTADTEAAGITLTTAGVPEPTTLSLMALAAGGLLGRRRRRR